MNITINAQGANTMDIIGQINRQFAQAARLGAGDGGGGTITVNRGGIN